MSEREAADAQRHIAEHQHDVHMATALGSLAAKIDIITVRQEHMDKKLDEVVAMTNRWKGATAILIIFGGVIGYLGNWVLKLVGKA
jgi:hypothetical protein